MKLLNKINQSFGFTKTESRLILFLVSTFVIGIGIKIYKSEFNSLPKYDYSAIDSEYTISSQKNISSDEAKVENDNIVADTTLMKTNSENRFNQKININKATLKELVALPGIGETMAKRIIEYRIEKGAFKNLDDLLNVRGIGKKKLNQLSKFITIEN
jgi:comEA protein